MSDAPRRPPRQFVGANLLCSPVRLQPPQPTKQRLAGWQARRQFRPAVYICRWLHIGQASCPSRKPVALDIVDFVLPRTQGVRVDWVDAKVRDIIHAARCLCVSEHVRRAVQIAAFLTSRERRPPPPARELPAYGLVTAHTTRGLHSLVLAVAPLVDLAGESGFCSARDRHCLATQMLSRPLDASE